jgi:hypothetical protein
MLEIPTASSKNNKYLFGEICKVYWEMVLSME